MLQRRLAGRADLTFLIKLDLGHEGYTPSIDKIPEDPQAHCDKISRYIQDADKAAWVIEHSRTHEQIAGILCWFRNLVTESKSAPNWSFYNLLRAHLPSDGQFCEVFNLWVDPSFRRQGLATQLKKQLEIESQNRAIKAIYTHTETTNTHVIDLNLKLGYKEVRRGPIWDEVERVSLVKHLANIS